MKFIGLGALALLPIAEVLKRTYCRLFGHRFNNGDLSKCSRCKELWHGQQQHIWTRKRLSLPLKIEITKNPEWQCIGCGKMVIFNKHKWDVNLTFCSRKCSDDCIPF